MDRPPVGEVSDLATLAQLDEKILFNELKVRYSKDRIYTYVGDILVAINPYKSLGIYGEDFSRKYNGVAASTLPSHIFAVADRSFQRMAGRYGSQPRNQCILISGESGAGKTESTKLIIRQLIELCRGNTYLEQQILQCNPVLEAFGNAQTVMNDNSSRFGRYIQLRFKNGQVMGSKISEYLLEKSRIVRQSPGEENFHIFYYMFAGLPPELQKKYHLSDPKTLQYICDGGNRLQTSRAELEQHYEELINAMDIVGFADDEQDHMFTLLSGALNTGNIDLGTNENAEAKVNNPAQIKIVSELLGLDESDVLHTMTCSMTFVKGQEIRRNYNLSQAVDSRDAIAKAVYGRLFGWIINKVNQLLAPKEVLRPDETQEIGILDIFGFEHFENNSFEQVCINLANEQLQFFFNQHIFMLEQEEYKKEGVDWREIKFVDNAPILELFLARPIGLLTLLDEESIIPNGSDQSFVDKLNNKFDDNPYYVKSPHSRSLVFTIKHYAGDVKYDASCWLEKNRDTMPPGVMEMLQESTNPLLSLIFKGKITRTGTLALQGIESTRVIRGAMKTGTSSKERKMSVSTQFKNSLTVLLEKMTAAEPVFIRCIKPNTQKTPSVFMDDFVEAQLLYTGMLETTKIRREGFAVRPTFAEFVDKYRVIARSLTMPPTAESCQEIMKSSNISGYQIGKTKVFLKYWHLEKLAEIMDEMAKFVIRIQKGARRFLAGLRVKRLRKEAMLQAAEASKLMKEVENGGNSWSNIQTKKISEDKKIPKDHFKKKDTGPPPAIPTSPLPAARGRESVKPPLPRVQRNLVDGSVPEDDFDQVSASQPQAGSRKASLGWFKQTQLPQIKEAQGQFAEWFHGIITRSEAERFLQRKPVGCFLVRVSESRFGYSLSFKAEDRCRHYMIDQTPSGKYIILGEPRVHRGLQDLIQYYRKTKLSNWSGCLGEACGQEEGQCDYWDLLNDEDRQYLEIEDKKAAPKHVKKSQWAAYDDVKGALAQCRIVGNGHIPPYPSPPPYSSGQGSPPPVPARNRLPSPFGGRPLKPLPIPGQTAASDPLQKQGVQGGNADRKVKLSTSRRRPAPKK